MLLASHFAPVRARPTSTVQESYMSSQSDKQVIRNLYAMGVSFVALTIILISVALSVT